MKRSAHRGRLDLEIQTLVVLSEAGEPVGSLRLSEALQEAGFDVAEATAGRLLREFDQAGFTRAVGRRGRVLTEAGELRLEELRRTRVQHEQSARLVQIIDVSRVEEVIDLLHARRAVEIEATRLAAERATDDELDRVMAAAQVSHDCAGKDNTRIGSSHLFHRQIAEASHNPLLIAIVQMLLDPAHDSLADVLDELAIPDEAPAPDTYANDHIQLARALHQRDGATAAKLMDAHFGRLISAVEYARGSRSLAEETLAHDLLETRM